MTIQMSTRPCGFCTTGTHQFCPGVVGEDEHRRQCPCGCPKSVTPYCKVCGELDDIRLDLWVCNDPAGCIQRVDRKRQEIREQLYPYGAPADKPTKTTTPKTAKACACGCGETTGGGTFKPGHADKLAKATAQLVTTGQITKQQATEQLAAISPGLVKKLEARI